MSVPTEQEYEAAKTTQAAYEAAVTQKNREDRNARRLASPAYMAGWRSYYLEDGPEATGEVAHSPLQGWIGCHNEHGRSSLSDIYPNFFDAISVEEANEVWELCLHEPDECANSNRPPTPYME